MIARPETQSTSACAYSDLMLPLPNHNTRACNSNKQSDDLRRIRVTTCSTSWINCLSLALDAASVSLTAGTDKL